MSRVFIVGAGPGDPELLTIKAHRLIARAEVVLHDDLVPQAILMLAPANARVINVGKRCGPKLLTQDDINQLMVEYSKQERIVVRLKGGDPAMFAHASEEYAALQEAQIEFEVVPGITSAFAAAAAAKMSLTDRRHSATVIFTTAHRSAGSKPINWSKLVQRESTLVIYMPGRDYAALARELHNAGLSPQTPCAVVSNAGRPEQKILWSRTGLLADLALLPSPALLLVGACAVAHSVNYHGKNFHDATVTYDMYPMLFGMK
jgi:uroporphyrin-III C-methyltransferase